MSHLARLLQYIGEFSTAEYLLRDALERAEKLWGTKKHYDVSTTMTHLAEVLRDVGEYEEATTLLEEVVGINAEILGENHPDLGWSLSAADDRPSVTRPTEGLPPGTTGNRFREGLRYSVALRSMRICAADWGLLLCELRITYPYSRNSC